MKNWNAIARLRDAQLMMLVATTQDEATLAGLQRGFPELFTEQQPEFDGVWPRSVVMKVMAEWSTEERDPPDMFLRERLGMPIINITDDADIQYAEVISHDELIELMEGLGYNDTNFHSFKIIPPIITLRDGRRFFVLQCLADDFLALPVEFVDCEK